MYEFLYLEKTRPVRNHGNYEMESVEYVVTSAIVFSESVVSPSIIAHIKLQAPKCLNLQQWQTKLSFMITYGKDKNGRN